MSKLHSFIKLENFQFTSQEMGEKNGKNNLCTNLYFLCSWKYMEEYCEKIINIMLFPLWYILCSWWWKFTSFKLGKALGQSLCFWCNGSSLLWLNLICNSANLFTTRAVNEPLRSFTVPTQKSKPMNQWTGLRILTNQYTHRLWLCSIKRSTFYRENAWALWNFTNVHWQL